MLSKAEVAEGIGAELFAICQDITADGALDDAETQSLLRWLAENEAAAAELPAVAFLVETTKRILADGRLTDSERREFQRAVEAVMPKEAREAASGARREVVAARRPALRLDFMAAGTRYHADEAGRVSLGDELELLREPTNPYDRNAVVVARLDGGQIGHVPREDAEAVAPLLDRGAMYQASCKKILGYNHAIPVVVASIFRPGVAVPGARFTREAGTVVLPSGRVHRPSAARAVLLILASLVAVGACTAAIVR